MCNGCVHKEYPDRVSCGQLEIFYCFELTDAISKGVANNIRDS